jgi:hypothetical protein
MDAEKMQPPFHKKISKSMDNTALPQDCVGRVARLDLAVNGHMTFCDRAVPNVVVTFSPA